jgi:hypothetical protein
MSTALQRSAITPWTGLGAGALAWIIDHQVGSWLSLGYCHMAGPWLTGGLGAVCIILILIGAGLTWSARRTDDHARGRPETRRFAVAVSMAGAALFGLAILYQSLPGFIVPACPP